MNSNKPIDRKTLDKLMEGIMAKKEVHKDIKEDKKLIRSMVKAKDLKKPTKDKK
jgi:hypothetical protein